MIRYISGLMDESAASAGVARFARKGLGVTGRDSAVKARLGKAWMDRFWFAKAVMVRQA